MGIMGAMGIMGTPGNAGLPVAGVQVQSHVIGSSLLHTERVLTHPSGCFFNPHHAAVYKRRFMPALSAEALAKVEGRFMQPSAPAHEPPEISLRRFVSRVLLSFCMSVFRPFYVSADPVSFSCRK